MPKSYLLPHSPLRRILAAERFARGFFELYDQMHELVRGARRDAPMHPAFFPAPGDRWGIEV